MNLRGSAPESLVTFVESHFLLPADPTVERLLGLFYGPVQLVLATVLFPIFQGDSIAYVRESPLKQNRVEAFLAVLQNQSG